jgi:hypothetical protein
MEPNESTTKNFNFFITAFFILNIFINLVKYENNLYTNTTYHHYRNQTEIELVVSERPGYNLSFFKLNDALKPAADFIFAHIDFSSIHKYRLIQYQNYVLVQLTSFNHIFILNQQFASILQNLWYHSSIELGNLVVR